MGLNAVAQGTDYPINLLNPFVNIDSIARKDIHGTVYGPAQAISREEALRLYTSSASWYFFSEHKTGSIEVGKLADLAILSDDPLSVEEDAIIDIVALKTMVGGKSELFGT
jgi:predicted amidohydrolase YtcJ